MDTSGTFPWSQTSWARPQGPRWGPGSPGRGGAGLPHWGWSACKQCKALQAKTANHTCITYKLSLIQVFFYFEEVVFLNVIIKGSLCMFNSDIHVQCINETYTNILKM